MSMTFYSTQNNIFIFSLNADFLVKDHMYIFGGMQGNYSLLMYYLRKQNQNNTNPSFCMHLHVANENIIWI